MATAIDVARYIIKKIGAVSAMKLQKLVYYCQAWALVWDEEPIFEDDIEAWANGPVVRSLYELHRGKYMIDESALGTSTSVIKKKHRETIDAVIKSYKNKSAQWLIDQTHMEKPWIEARQGLAESERGSHPITHAAMAEYYGSLQ